MTEFPLLASELREDDSVIENHRSPHDKLCNSAMLDQQEAQCLAAEVLWDHYEHRELKVGERFRWCFGSAMSNPQIRFGTVVRIGHDRFSDQYRVPLDDYRKDE